ncbi:MAG TPA: hypothetical protein VKR38_12790 [Usitatibacter sp.]|nr:hypothetical protein [Usitatibacter sp.]
MIRRRLWGAIAALLLAASAWAEDTGGLTHGYDYRSYGTAISEILGALSKRDFARLDAMYAEYGSAGVRTRDGTWMLKAFPAAFDAIFPSYPEGQVEEIFRDWKARDPDSSLRPIAEAFAWQSRAWAAKGGYCYENASSSQRKAFNALIDRSADSLRAAETRGRDSPLWHMAAILVAGAQLRPAPDLDALLGEAVARFPAFEPLYAARMTFFLPVWGGNFEIVDRFIRSSAAATRANEGRALYAWLYLDLAATPGCGQLFDRSSVSWPDMKVAFDDMLQRHPDDHNRNVYATFACRERDVETTSRLLRELGSEARLGMWSQGISNESCRAMVRGAAPAAARERDT